MCEHKNCIQAPVLVLVKQSVGNIVLNVWQHWNWVDRSTRWHSYENTSNERTECICLSSVTFVMYTRAQSTKHTVGYIMLTFCNSWRLPYLSGHNNAGLIHKCGDAEIYVHLHPLYAYNFSANIVCSLISPWLEGNACTDSCICCVDVGMYVSVHTSIACIWNEVVPITCIVHTLVFWWTHLAVKQLYTTHTYCIFAHKAAYYTPITTTSIILQDDVEFEREVQQLHQWVLSLGLPYMKVVWLRMLCLLLYPPPASLVICPSLTCSWIN